MSTIRLLERERVLVQRRPARRLSSILVGLCRRLKIKSKAVTWQRATARHISRVTAFRRGPLEAANLRLNDETLRAFLCKTYRILVNSALTICVQVVLWSLLIVSSIPNSCAEVRHPIQDDGLPRIGWLGLRSQKDLTRHATVVGCLQRRAPTSATILLVACLL